MKEAIDQKFEDLAEEGEVLVSEIGEDPEMGGPAYWVPEEALGRYSGWLSSAEHLLRITTPTEDGHLAAFKQAQVHDRMEDGIPATVFQKAVGILNAANADWKAGLLHQLEYVIVSATFDDFLDHADRYHAAGKKKEAAVLASAVLEDTMKKVCEKHNVNSAGQTLDPLIDDLVKAGVFTLIKAKRLKAATGVRNSADHARWDEFELTDVEAQIHATRDLIENSL